MAFNRLQKSWDMEYSCKGEVWSDRGSANLPEYLSGKKVLELGVGDGKTLAKILARKPESVKAVDFSHSAIKQCIEKFRDCANVELIESDLCKLPFSDSCFDVVVCRHVLGHLAKADRVIASKEIVRVLGKKGIIVFEDFAIGDMRFGKGTPFEENSFMRGNGILYHYFSVAEVISLFGLEGNPELVSKKLKLAGKEVTRAEIKGELLKK